MKKLGISVIAVTLVLMALPLLAATKKQPNLAAVKVFVTTPGGIWSMQGDGTNRQWLTYLNGYWDFEPVPSPNGRWLVFTSTRPIDRFNIYLMDLTSGGLSRLTFSIADHSPCWLDNENIVCSSVTDWETLSTKLYTLNINQPEIMTLITDSPDWIIEQHPTCDSNGNVYYESDELDPENGTRSIWSVNIYKSLQRKLVVSGENLDARDPAISSDGKKIAYDAYFGENYSIYQVYTARTDQALPVIGSSIGITPSLFPAWHPNGKGLFFSRENAIGYTPLNGNWWFVNDFYSWDPAVILSKK